jgi:serine/threonine-protein kinase
MRPDPGRCPEEARDAMREAFRMGDGNLAGYISLGGKQFTSGVLTQESIAFKEGPITAIIVRDNQRADGPGLPKGTLLFGHVWTDLGFKGATDAEYALVRFTRIETPQGKTYPVCIVAFDDDGLAIKRAGSRPGVAVLFRFGNAVVIDTWPPPPGPYQFDTEQ